MLKGQLEEEKCDDDEPGGIKWEDANEDAVLENGCGGLNDSKLEGWVEYWEKLSNGVTPGVEEFGC